MYKSCGKALAVYVRETCVGFQTVFFFFSYTISQLEANTCFKINVKNSIMHTYTHGTYVYTFLYAIAWQNIPNFFYLKLYLTCRSYQSHMSESN